MNDPIVDQLEDPFEIRTVGVGPSGSFFSSDPEFHLTARGPGKTETLPELRGKVQTSMGVYTSTRGRAALLAARVSFADEVQVDPRMDRLVGGKRRRT